jgi:spermidine/putrescine transport system ATP-binding protein
VANPLDLHIAGVSKSFPSITVLRDLSLIVPDGQFATLLGPSGCGKTTLLRILAGFEVPDAGQVTLGGADLLALPAHKRPVNTVFQSYALFPHLRVADNVAFGLHSRRVPAADIARRGRAIMELLQIADLAQRHPHELSGGQRQRVALARALVNEPEVLLLDEPLSALDAKLRKEVQAELKRIQRHAGITFILVTHDQDEAIAVSDRILIMHQGAIVQDGTPEEVYERPVNRFVADFLGVGNRLAVTGDGSSAVVQGPFGPLRLPAPPPWRAGTLAVRLEDIEVRDAQPAVNGFAATVSERLFRGDHWELRVLVGQTTLSVMTNPDQHHHEGQQVWIELPPAYLVPLAD